VLSLIIRLRREGWSSAAPGYAAAHDFATTILVLNLGFCFLILTLFSLAVEPSERSLMLYTALFHAPPDSVTGPDATRSGTLSCSISGVGDAVGLTGAAVVGAELAFCAVFVV